MLTIAAPNTDRSLLTLAERRAAAGVTDSSKDATLTALGHYVDAMITKACRVATADAIPPTLRLETVTEKFHLKSYQSFLVLSRQPLVEIMSVVDGIGTLAATQYEHDRGLFYKVQSPPWRIAWPLGNVTVEYSAGFAVVPDDLKYAAIRFMQAELQQGNRDPLLKSKTIEGVSHYEWWVDPSKPSVVPSDVMDILEQGGFVRKYGWMGS